MIAVLVGMPLAGKTHLLKELSVRGIKVFSADTFVNQIYQKGQPGYIKIRDEIDSSLVNKEGVDKKALALWASDDENLKRLNELIHPLIKEYLNDKDGFVAELPIVTSSPVKFNYNKLILVKANPEVIKERFAQRNFAAVSFIEKIIEDWNNEIKADYVVDTTNGLKEEDISNIIKLINEN